MKRATLLTLLVLMGATTVIAKDVVVLQSNKKTLPLVQHKYNGIPPLDRVQFTNELDNGIHYSVACMAANIYYEARSEPLLGKISVGYVTLNRSIDKKFPDTICEVVAQPSQFSWYNDRTKVHYIKEPKQWKNAVRLSRAIIAGSIEDPTEGALYYHREDVYPVWSNHVAYATQIGVHKFYY